MQKAPPGRPSGRSRQGLFLLNRQIQFDLLATACHSQLVRSRQAGLGIARSTAKLQLSKLEASGQVVLLEPWFSDSTKPLVKTITPYFADTCPLCALLNVRPGKAPLQSPAAGAVWESRVFAQLRDRERDARRTGSLVF